MDTLPHVPSYPGYRVFEAFNLSELSVFVMKQILKPTPWTIGYGLAVLGLSALFGAMIAHAEKAGASPFAHITWSLILLLPLIVVHEALHGLFYKLTGAPQVRFGANLKALAVYAYAEGFVIGRAGFTRMAIAPFVVITGVLLIVLPFVSPAWAVGLSLLAAVHALACIGDFGLVSYFYRHRHLPIYTVDELSQKRVLFLLKEQPGTAIG